ncbi:MAG TPA: trehalase family glycosidase, partial [Puia sp.]
MPAGRLLLLLLFSVSLFANPPQSITIHNAHLSLTLETGDKAAISSLVVNGQKVLGGSDGAYTSITIGANTYSSLHLLSTPTIIQRKDSVIVDGIRYGDEKSPIRERWMFVSSGTAIRWTIERNLPAAARVEASATPVFQFDGVDVWNGAYQGYGGLAWFYLFNEKLCTYGVHTRLSSFWNSKTGNGLDVSVEAPGKQVAMKYTRTNDDRLAYGVTVSNAPMLPRYDSGTHRRRFIRGKTDVWAAFDQAAGKSSETITLGYFDVNERYGRGRFVGIDGARVNAVLNTIARIGVIDSLHFGGNSWHTPYGPICLHEQYIAQMGLAINDPHYLRGYQDCLDFYRDHAIRPDGRVIPRWAYTDEDMMPGQNTPEGFYEAQWGFLLDSNPDFVTNVAELYDQTGNLAWVRTQETACEKALDWILARDSDGDGLVEMMTDNEKQKRGSDWIDIIWASFENAFVNAKLYHALVKWAAIERQLNNGAKAALYEAAARKLKTSFNKSTREGGFWDEEKGCYVHWLDKDGSPHGRNMVTPVNFMAIAYGICEDANRSKQILDTIETQMEKEQLFFWPLCMTSYAPGDGNDWQWPFPNYENGDLFLSWGSVAAKAYATYRPEVAVRYIRKVLDQYSKDGLAFQRYGRTKQDGRGDDILSGNSLSIVGLYQAIYGINPLYNRFYLEPHITPELAGTELRYKFRGQVLTIGLEMGRYTVADRGWSIAAPSAFGFFHTGDTLQYFAGGEERPSLEAKTPKPLKVSVLRWEPGIREWRQEAAGPVDYLISGLKPHTTYSFFNSGVITKGKSITTNAAGEIVFHNEG